MKALSKPAFLVNTSDHAVFVLIQGKANFLNANTFKQFIDASLKKPHTYYIIDFENCTGMDSTFLGIIAWLGLQIKQSKGRSHLIVLNFNQRNKELFYNLGLQNFITTEEAILEASALDPARGSTLTPLEEGERCKAIDVLNAHKTLVEASKGNATLFKDLINLLENKVQSE